MHPRDQEVGYFPSLLGCHCGVDISFSLRLLGQALLRMSGASAETYGPERNGLDVARLPEALCC